MTKKTIRHLNIIIVAHSPKLGHIYIEIYDDLTQSKFFHVRKFTYSFFKLVFVTMHIKQLSQFHVEINSK